MKKIISLFVIFLLNVNIVFASNGLSIYTKSYDIDENIFKYGKITDSYNGNDNSLVIWIQDLHNDPAVQKNIYGILDTLSKKSNPEIYIEGAGRGKFDASVFKLINGKNIRNSTAKKLLNEGVLSGSEYYAVINDDNNKIYGIENEDIYIQNLKKLEIINSRKQFNNYIISKTAKCVNNIKKKHVLNSIIASQNIDIRKMTLTNLFPNLQKQQSILNIFDKINYSRLNKELNDLITDSKGNISSDDYTDFSKFINYNSAYGYAKAYDYIKKNTEKSLDNQSDLTLFLKANKILLEINPIKLIYEKELLKKQLLTAANLNNTEKEILDLDHFTFLLNNLINTVILPEQYAELKKNRKYAQSLYEKYLHPVIKNFTLNLLNNEILFDFYDANLNRNEIFIKNINSKNEGMQIIVAGGFHSGLTETLKKNNKSYIVITPETSATGAFNQLFISSFKDGTDKQILDNFFLIVEKWGMFFSDAASFQNEILKWTKQIPKLQDINVRVLNIEGGFLVDADYNDLNKYKSFKYNTNIVSKRIQEDFNPSKKQIEQTLNKISDIAKKNQLFGKKTTVSTNNDNSLFESSVLLPIKLTVENGENKISINKSFLKALAVQDENLIETVIHLLYFYYSLEQNTELFQEFINNNYDKLLQIYSINAKIQESNNGFFTKFQNKIKNFINKFTNSNFTRQNISLEKFKKLSESYIEPDQLYMIEALKQAELSKQSKKFLKTFVQPPVGAFIINDDSFTGKAYNQDNSVLHAETLTIINFLQNTIIQEELMPDGKLTTKGKQLYSLLELAFLNGQNIGNKIFQNKPIILENLGIHIEYAKKRTIDDVFNETNTVLKFVDDQLDNPLKTASLYCTLAPCNKCLKTMKLLGIEKLAYGSSSVNKTHHGINSLAEKGTVVQENLLKDETDKYITNYRFMNSSILKTNAASLVQFLQRTLSSLFKKPDRKLKKQLYSNIRSLGLERTLEIIKDFQLNIDWNSFLKNEDLSKLKIFLERIDAWNDPAKRAGMIYVMKNNINAFTEKDKIYFEDKKGRRFNFYINSDSHFTASNEYMSKMKILSKVKNFADVDDNIALRKSKFNEEMSVIFSTLNLYGTAQPIIITGNTLVETNVRLKPLGEVINTIMPSLYIENAALEYDYVNGEFIENTNYMNNIAKSFIDQTTISDIKATMSKVKGKWYSLFTGFVFNTKEIRNKPDLSYKELIEAAISDQKHSEPLNFLMARAGIEVKDKTEFFNYYGSLSRDKAMNEINKFYNLMMIIDISETKMLDVMETLSILEMARLYLSKDPADIKERNSVIIDINKIENNEQLKTDLHSNVRVAISPVRPSLVRAKVADYYNRKINQKYPNIMARSAGQTTITIYKKDITKMIPIQHAISQGTPGEYIIYTGDEFGTTGVDYPIYLLQQQQGNGQMVVINTNGQQFDGTFISLSSLPEFSKNVDSAANINRSVILQKKILEIVENNIWQIAVNPSFQPDNIAQELKNRLLSPAVIEINRQPQMKNIEDLLKAG